MSLAFHASPFDNESNYVETKNNMNNNNDTAISRKKNANNRTQKRAASNSDKVNSMLASIHNSSNSDGSELGDFNPPSMPQSSGVQNTILKENMSNINSHINQEPPDYPPHNGAQMFNEDASGDLNGVKTNYGDSATAEEYYRKMIPNFQQNQHSQNPNLQLNTKHNNHAYNSRNNANVNANKQYYSYANHDVTLQSGDNDNIMEKLNYMINLLEENHDERTGNVTEEVILYSFLGIFIIFIADSFARVGKYTR